MIGSLDPLGMPLATDVVSGARACKRLNHRAYPHRIAVSTGLLFVGDCKMSALDTRAYLARHQTVAGAIAADGGDGGRPWRPGSPPG